VESGVGRSNRVLVGSLELIETLAVIELSTDVQVLIHEVVQFLGEFCVLVGKAGGVGS